MRLSLLGLRGASACLITVLVAFASTARPASADSSLDDAQRRVVAAQRAADTATARYATAYDRLQRVGNDLAKTEEQLHELQDRAAQLRIVASRRAVDAYTNRGATDDALGIDDALDAERRETLLEELNAHDNDAVDALSALTDDVNAKQQALARDRTSQRALVQNVRAQEQSMKSELARAQQAKLAVEQRLAAEAAQRKQRDAQARSAASKRAPSTRAAPVEGGPAGQILAPGDGRALVCPVQGAVSFVDSWGAPRAGGRRHQGVDLMAARGTPNVAIVGGTVTQKSGGISGLGVRLHGDDGNLYYYFHLSAYAGGSRHVQQGEVIGYVGNTGDASGGPAHTHFEYHPGGGGAVNPYPLVRPIC